MCEYRKLEIISRSKDREIRSHLFTKAVFVNVILTAMTHIIS